MFLCFISLIIPVSTFCDLTITTVDSDGTKTVEYYSQNRYACYENGSITDSIDLPNNTISIFDPQKKIYTCEKVDIFVRETIKQQEEMKKQLSSMGINMPVPAKKDNKITYEKKLTKKIAGHECEQYIMKMNNSDFIEIWISPTIQKLIDKEFDPKKAQKLQKEMKSLSKDIDPTANATEILEKKGYPVYEDYLAASGGLGMLFGDNPMFNLPKDQLKTKTPSDGSKISIIINSDKISPQIFSIPAGFSRKTIAEFNSEQQQEEEIEDEDSEDYDDDMDMDFDF
jgi:hypothetical protein